MKTILIDANFAMLPFRIGIDIFKEFTRIIDSNFKISILEENFSELLVLSNKGRGKQSQYAKMALILLKSKSVMLEKSKRVINESDFHLLNRAVSNGDEAILNYCQEFENRKELLVATDDAELKKKLKLLRVSTIHSRNKKYLVIGVW
jgi:rRNA-processing protein FCF1